MEKFFKNVKKLKIKPFWYVIISLLAIFSGLLISQKIYKKYFVRRVVGALIHTTKGDIEIKFRKETPKTAENFIFLSKSGFYDETLIYRIVPKLLIEMGDPLTKDVSKITQWGTGGPGYTFPDEIDDDDAMVRGSVAMSNSGPDSNGSRFFIMVDDAMWLDLQHTIFATVETGMEVVDEIATFEVGVTGIPVNSIKIEKIELLYSK